MTIKEAVVMFALLATSGAALAQDAQPQARAATTVVSDVPMVLFVEEVEVQQMHIGAPEAPEYFGIVRVVAYVRNGDDTPLVLGAIFPPTSGSNAAGSVPTLDLFAKAIPGSSAVCAFSKITATFSYQSKVPLSRVRVRSAANAITLDSTGVKNDKFVSPDCAGAIGATVAGNSNAAPTQLGSAKYVRTIGPNDGLSDMTVNPNRASLFLDEASRITAIVWQ